MRFPWLRSAYQKTLPTSWFHSSPRKERQTCEERENLKIRVCLHIKHQRCVWNYLQTYSHCTCIQVHNFDMKQKGFRTHIHDDLFNPSTLSTTSQILWSFVWLFNFKNFTNFMNFEVIWNIDIKKNQITCPTFRLLCPFHQIFKSSTSSIV